MPDTKQVWSVENHASGCSLGYYMADSETDAIDAIIDAHGGLDTPYSELRAHRVDMAAAANLMDDTIRERLHAQDFDNDADFLTVYELMHWNKYRETFVF